MEHIDGFCYDSSPRRYTIEEDPMFSYNDVDITIDDIKNIYPGMLDEQVYEILMTRVLKEILLIELRKKYTTII